MKSGRSNTGIPWIYFSLSLVVWLYVLLRAWKVQFGIDEAATFFMYIQTGRFLPPNAVLDANNHLLNSFLTWICYQFTGSHPFVLRLPNVLAAPVYLFFIYKISRLFHSKLNQWVFIAVSLGTHFIIEFFSYTRGYGLSMAFLTGSLYYLLLLSQEVRLPRLVYALVFIFLAMTANLNILFTGLAMSAIMLVFIFLQRIKLEYKVAQKGTLLILVFGIPVFFLLISYSFRLSSASALYYGAGDGFFPVTVQSLTAMVSGPDTAPYAVYLVVLFFSMTMLLLFSTFRKAETTGQFLPAWIFLTLCLINWIGPLGLHYIKNVNFQEDRAAIHLLPLFLGFVLFSFDHFFRKPASLWHLVLIPLLLIPAYSLNKISLHHSVYGKRQQVPVEFFRLIQQRAKQDNFPPVVSAYQVKRQPWAFMNYRSGGFLNPLYVKNLPWKYADYLILNDSIPSSWDVLYTNLMNDKRTGATLYSRNNSPSTRIFQSIPIDPQTDIEIMYTRLYHTVTDSLFQKSLFISLDLSLYSMADPFEAAVVAELLDENSQNLVYEAIDLNQLRYSWTENSGQLRHRMVINEVPPEAGSLIIYIWNKNEVKYNLGEGKIILEIIQGEEDDSASH